MLLIIDIGNTNVVASLFDGKEFSAPVRFKTRLNSTLSRFSAYIKSIDFNHAVVSSVVPEITEAICTIIHKPYIVVSRDIKTGMDNDSLPLELGSDIICNLTAAHYYYPDEYVTVADFGTAFTTETVSPEGKMLGVTIAPGLWTSIKALFSNASQIPSIELQMPKTVLGKDTIASVRAGCVYGFKGQLEAIVEQIEKEAGHKVRLVVTGGFSKYIAEVVPRIDLVDVLWTLKGAKLIYEFNR